MSNSIETSYGTTISYNSSGTTYTELTEILDIGGPEAMRKTIDTSAIADTVTFKKPGRPDYGDVTLQVGFVKAGFQIFHGLYVSGVLTGYKIGNPTNTLQSFSAYVVRIGPKYPNDEKIVFDVTLAISGAVTVA